MRLLAVLLILLATPALADVKRIFGNNEQDVSRLKAKADDEIDMQDAAEATPWPVKSSAPTCDDEGEAYYNSSSNGLQVCDGSSWDTLGSGGGSGSPGGSNTDIQWNNSSSFDGDSELTWNAAGDRLVVGLGDYGWGGLSIKDATDTQVGMVSWYVGPTAISSGIFVAGKSSGTIGGEGAVPDADVFGIFRYAGHDDTSPGIGCDMTAKASGLWANGSNLGTDWTLSCVPDGTTAVTPRILVGGDKITEITADGDNGVTMGATGVLGVMGTGEIVASQLDGTATNGNRFWDIETNSGDPPSGGTPASGVVRFTCSHSTTPLTCGINPSGEAYAKMLLERPGEGFILQEDNSIALPPSGSVAIAPQTDSTIDLRWGDGSVTEQVCTDTVMGSCSDAADLTGTIAAARVGAAHIDALTEIGDLCAAGEYLARNTGDSAWECVAKPGAFSALTSSTNTTATMIVGSGASLSPTSLGVVTANYTDCAAGALLDGNSVCYTTPGTGTAVATTTGTHTSGRCAEFDANGDLAPSGAACGGGGGGGLSVSAIFHGKGSCQGGTEYMGYTDDDCENSAANAEGIVHSAAWTATSICCNITGDSDCDALLTLVEDGTAQTDLQIQITDAASACDTGERAIGATDKISIKVVENGGTSCGSSSRFGCVLFGTVD